MITDSPMTIPGSPKGLAMDGLPPMAVFDAEDYLDTASGAYDGRDPKQLREDAAKLMEEAKAYSEANDAKWAAHHQAVFDRMLAEAKRMKVKAESLSSGFAFRDGNSPQYLTAKDEKGRPIYGTSVAMGQRYSDQPGIGRPEDPHAIGSFMKAIATGEGPKQMVSLATTTGSAGGFNVIPQHAGSVLDMALEQMALARLGMITYTLQSNVYQIPRIDSLPEATVKVEDAKFDESAPTFSLVNVVPRMFGFLLRVSHELMMDAGGIEEVLTRVMGQAMAQAIDRAGIQGSDGLGGNSGQEIAGLTGYALPETTGGTIDQMGWGDVLDAALGLRKQNYSFDGMLLNPVEAFDLARQRGADGHWLDAPEILQGQTRIDTNHCPERTAFIGDFSQYALALREGLRIDVSNQAGEAFERAQYLFRVMWRGNYCLTRTDAIHKIVIEEQI